MAMEGGFGFPVMTNDEIVGIIDGCWGLQVTRAQIQKPTPDVVQAIYSLFLSKVTGITMETLQEPVQISLTVTDEEYADLYTHALGHTLFLHHLTRLAAAAKVQGFCSKDLVLPEPERTRYVLSGLINFVRFVDERQERVMQLWKRSEGMLEERDSVVQEVTELKQKIAQIKTQRMKDEPRCEALREENAQLTGQLIATKEIQSKLLSETTALKEEKAFLVQRKESLNQDISLVADNVTRLRSRIVQSPERIKRHIVQMSATAQEERKIVVSNEGKARDLQAKADALTAIEQDIRANIEQLQIIERENVALEAAEKMLADLNAQMDERHIDRNELRARQERVYTQLANAQDKLERAQKHAEEKRMASQVAIERLKREYEEMSVERKDNDKHVEETRQEANEIERKMADHLKKSEAELSELLTAYWQLRHQIEIYMETLANKFGIQIPVES